jgi:hypothetical protein
MYIICSIVLCARGMPISRLVIYVYYRNKLTKFIKLELRIIMYKLLKSSTLRGSIQNLRRMPRTRQ